MIKVLIKMRKLCCVTLLKFKVIKVKQNLNEAFLKMTYIKQNCYFSAICSKYQKNYILILYLIAYFTFDHQTLQSMKRQTRH